MQKRRKLCYTSAMQYVFVGLGNPGEEYEGTRHNVGREAVLLVAKKLEGAKFPEFKFDKRAQALVAEGNFKKQKITAVLPETFMNKSGAALRSFVRSAKQAEQLVVFHDDLDLPLGSFKISFNKGPGGHRGLVSVIKAVGTEKFTRFRIGIAKATLSGKVKKPQGEKAVIDFILGRFSPKEKKVLAKVFKRINEALEVFLTESREKAMSLFSTRRKPRP